MPPVERGTQGVMLTREPFGLIDTQLVAGLLDSVDVCLFEEVLSVRGERSAVRLMLGEALACELADRLQHREPAVSLADEALVDERRERVQVAVTDLLGRIESPAAGEDAQACHEVLFMRLEEVVAPLDRGAQRALPLWEIPRSAGEQRQRLLEPLEEHIRGEQLDPRGGQLDRERETVETAADLADGAVGGKVGPDGPGALVEKGHGVGGGQRRDRVLLLDGEMER